MPFAFVFSVLLYINLAKLKKQKYLSSCDQFGILSDFELKPVSAIMPFFHPSGFRAFQDISNSVMQTLVVTILNE